MSDQQCFDDDITAPEAATIAAKWKGYDGPYSVSLDEEGDCVISYEGTAIARVENFDEHTEPLARLFASAPDDVKALARTVEMQAAEIDRLRAIATGRTTPPTPEEIAKHDGYWLVVQDHAAGYCTRIVSGDDAVELARQQLDWPKFRAWVWHPFDERDGEMKVWPVIAEESK